MGTLLQSARPSGSSSSPLDWRFGWKKTRWFLQAVRSFGPSWRFQSPCRVATGSATRTMPWGAGILQPNRAARFKRRGPRFHGVAAARPARERSGPSGRRGCVCAPKHRCRTRGDCSRAVGRSERTSTCAAAPSADGATGSTAAGDRFSSEGPPSAASAAPGTHASSAFAAFCCCSIIAG